MTAVYDLADRYVDRAVALDPVGATLAGIPCDETELTDHSPKGAEARASLDRETLASLAAIRDDGERDRIARAVLQERLLVQLDEFAAGEHLCSLQMLFSPLQQIHMYFERMPRTSAAERQVTACAAQAEQFGGLRDASPPYFQALVSTYERSPGREDALQSELERQARQATSAYAEMAVFLRDEYGPHATTRDAVGPERYALANRAANGISLDLQEAYDWAWDALCTTAAELESVAATIDATLPAAGVVRQLDADPAHAVTDREDFRRWVQERQDAAIAAFDGTHFAVPEPLKRIEVQLSPPGGPPAPAWYEVPTEGFTRPGQVWLSTDEHLRLPRWRALGMTYHEGVPGHHLQLGFTRYLAGELSRFQRLLAFIPGWGEGWASYAERLVRELGYFDEPAYLLGALQSQAVGLAGSVIDIGLHLELAIPETGGFHPGERWTPELARALLVERGYLTTALAANLTTRSLGWPGQATAYRLGERAWLAAREQARQQAGAAFDLKAFHDRALRLGPMGLGQMQQELAAVSHRDGS